MSGNVRDALGNAVTEGSLRLRMADPRNDATQHVYDPDFLRETDRQYKEFYGDASPESAGPKE